MEVNTSKKSSGVAKAGLATGIVGSTLGLLGGMGGLGTSLLNGGANNGVINQSGCCTEDHYVDRYDAQQMHRISELETQVAFKDVELRENDKALKLYQYVNDRFGQIDKEIAAQAVRNQAVSDSFGTVNERMGHLKDDLTREISNEAERRCAADNTIIGYVNCTFVPQNIIGCTPDPTVINPKRTYNPLPAQNCGGCGNCGGVNPCGC